MAAAQQEAGRAVNEIKAKMRGLAARLRDAEAAKSSAQQSAVAAKQRAEAAEARADEAEARTRTARAAVARKGKAATEAMERARKAADQGARVPELEAEVDELKAQLAQVRTRLEARHRLVTDLKSKENETKAALHALHAELENSLAPLTVVSESDKHARSVRKVSKHVRVLEEALVRVVDKIVAACAPPRLAALGENNGRGSRVRELAARVMGMIRGKDAGSVEASALVMELWRLVGCYGTAQSKLAVSAEAESKREAGLVELEESRLAGLLDTLQTQKLHLAGMQEQMGEERRAYEDQIGRLQAQLVELTK